MSIFSFDRPVQESKNVKLTGSMARKCLSSELFQDYRKSYEKSEKDTIEELIQESMKSYVEGDISKFGTRCLIKLMRLRDLRALLTKVKSDSLKDTEVKSDE